jgi:hypothetical protein
MLVSRMTVLRKENGGLRPIAVGELMWRLIAKVLVRWYKKDDMLLGNQMGVGSAGGVEPIVRAIEKAVKGELPDSYTHLHQLDFSNAFNAASRSDAAKALRTHAPEFTKTAQWAYGEPQKIVIVGEGENHLLSSSSGFRQGDPLSPFLFSLSIRHTLEDLQRTLENENAGPFLLLAYLDDICILSNDPDTIETVELALAGSSSTLKLNVAKSITTPLSRIEIDGIEILGTAIGSYPFRQEFLVQKIDEQRVIINQLPALSFQTALILLRRCIQMNLRHLQRSLSSSDLVLFWKTLDRLQWEEIQRLRSSNRHWGAQEDAIAHLPARLGGLGIPSFEITAPLAYAAAVESADHFLAPLLSLPIDDDFIPTSQRVRCDKAYQSLHADLLGHVSPLHAQSLVESASLLGRTALDVLPTTKSFTLTDREISAALHFKTLCPGQATICSQGHENDFGHAELCDAYPPFSTSRHEIIKRQLISSLRSCPSFTVDSEPTDRATGLRTDFKVTSHNGVKEFDLSIISISTIHSRAVSTATFNKLSAADPSPSPSSLASACLQSILADKAKEKEDKYRHVQVPFGAFVLSIGGGMEESAMETLKGWKEELGPSYWFLVRRMSVSLLKARATVWCF